ncbi:MAG: histone deacetylase [Polyangiaceae bacterium]|nr:histone deacetylase [Polyangiaceae bacterium]
MNPRTDLPPGRTLHVADDALFDEHRSRGHHPERPERLIAARHALDRCAAAGVHLSRIPTRDARDEDLARAHALDYLDALERLRGQDASLDVDTYVSPGSVAAARRAAGSAIALVEALVAPGAPSAGPGLTAGVALLRPPGHHATRATGMGFCLLNNAAIAALAALESGLSRVAVVDFDVHHGNGTQDILWRDPRALFISVHQWPFYPGTGATSEVGAGEGAGYTVNVPLSEGATDAVYRAVFDEIVLPILDEHAPELILVSAGFDAHRRDPLAAMELTEAAYGTMVRRLGRLAARKGAGRLGLILEGGYDLHALEDSLAAALLGAVTTDEPAAAPATGTISGRHRGELDRASQQARRHWSTL